MHIVKPEAGLTGTHMALGQKFWVNSEPLLHKNLFFGTERYHISGRITCSIKHNNIMIRFDLIVSLDGTSINIRSRISPGAYGQLNLHCVCKQTELLWKCVLSEEETFCNEILPFKKKVSSVAMFWRCHPVSYCLFTFLISTGFAIFFSWNDM